MRRTVLLALTTVLALYGVSSAQEPSAQEPPDTSGESAEPFVETVDVHVVNVEVYVTDKKGNRIRGLTKDDFLLEVDKKPLAITNFFAVEEGVSTAGRESALAEPVEEGLLPDRSQPEGLSRDIPADQRLHLIVYVDNFNLHPFSRNRTLATLRTFLRTRLNPGDEAMLVSYDRSFHVRQPFTTDHESVAAATYELEELSAHAVHKTSDRRDLLQDIFEAEDGRFGMLAQASNYAGSIYNDTEFTLDSLRDLVDNLAGLPGRKAILYVSDGLPMRPGEDIYQALYEKFADSSILMEVNRFDLSRRYTQLTTHANANRVSFYTLDAAGLRTYSYMDASNMNPGGGSGVDRVHFTNIQSTLQMLASETGGQVLMNTNDFGPMLERVADDFDTYYSLGFMPASSESGRYHDIKIELKDGKGLKVRHRQGYRDKPVATRMTEGTLAALHFGTASNSLGLEIKSGRGTRGSSGTYEVPFAVRFPMSKLVFVPAAEMYRGRVRLYIAAKDQDGGLAPVQEISIPIDVPADEWERAQQQIYQYILTLEMRGGRQVVAIGVRDEFGALEGFTTHGLTVGS